MVEHEEAEKASTHRRAGQAELHHLVTNLGSWDWELGIREGNRGLGKRRKHRGLGFRFRHKPIQIRCLTHEDYATLYPLPQHVTAAYTSCALPGGSNLSRLAHIAARKSPSHDTPVVPRQHESSRCNLWAALLSRRPRAARTQHRRSNKATQSIAVAEPTVGGKAVEGEAELLHSSGGDPRPHDGAWLGPVLVLHGERIRVVREEPAELGLEHVERRGKEAHVEVGGGGALELGYRVGEVSDEARVGKAVVGGE